MAKTIKPNNFPTKSLPLNGSEELYTQEGGVSNKFTVSDVWDGVTQVTTIVPTGDTIINNNVINLSGTDTVLISGGTTVVPTGSTIINGSTSDVTDNADGTYTHHDGITVLNDVTIKPADYSSVPIKTGERWIDGKLVYRLVIQLAQWTQLSDSTGTYLLGAGQTFESVVRLDFFTVATKGAQRTVANLNTGNGEKWAGGVSLFYDGADSYLVWENMATFFSALAKPTPYIILEYTRP